MPEIQVKIGTEDVSNHVLDQEVIRIGRSRDNDVMLDHLSVSRHHAELRLDHGHWVVTDLDSANGTFVNGQRITTVPLYHSDTITVGKHHLHFFDSPVDQDSIPIHDFDDEQTMLLNAPSKVVGCLTVTKGKERGREFNLVGERTLIGRASDCDIQISDWLVSKCHAQILRSGDQFSIEDLGSWRAIQVNGVPVKKSVLTDGDSIQLGGTKLNFRHVSSAEASKPAENELAKQPDDTGGGYKLAVSTAAEMADSAEPEKEAAAVAAPEAPAESEEQEKVPVEVSASSNGNGAQPAAEASEASVATADEDDADESDPNVALWLRMYKTGGPAMKRHAAQQLKVLTGRDYE